MSRSNSGGVALATLSLALLLGCGCSERRSIEAPDPAPARYAGSAACQDCHAAQFAAWRDSDHWHAMQPAQTGAVARFASGFEHAGRTTRFNQSADGLRVTTDDLATDPATFAVPYAFGVAPLQQFLVDTGQGRLQALAVAWDSRDAPVGGQRWFHLREDEVVDPDDVLHWTRSSHNWNFMCADCHSTGVRKNYDPPTRSYATFWEEVTVGCEACHGPASNHVQSPAASLPLSLEPQHAQVNACAPCHSRRSQLAEEFRPESDYFDHYLPALLDEDLYHPDGQILDEVYVLGSFLQSKMHRAGVKCSNCHEPHSGRVIIEGNGLCTQCHSESGRAGFATLQAKNYDAPSHHFHEPGSSGSRCVSCHMTAETYMVIDPRRDHSFRIPRPDLTLSLGVPNACSKCHSRETAQWAADHLERRFGPAPPHYGQILAAARSADPGVEDALAALGAGVLQPAIVRATALALMAGYDRGVTSTALAAGLFDAEPIVRIGALRGAARWEPARRWREVRRLLSDEILSVRMEAVRVLLPAMAELEPNAQRELRGAMQEYLASLALHADRAEGQSSIAAVHLANGDIPAAEAALHEALTLNSKWVPGLVNLADLYRATGRDRLGGELLEQAAVLAPENADVLLARALWLVRQNAHAQALPLLESAWRHGRQVRFAYVYAIALNDSGDAEAALAVLDTVLAERRDQQVLETALAIARDAGLDEKVATYQRR